MNNDALIIETIMEYCEKIQNAMDRFGGDEEDFVDDPDYQQSCSFCISQIGELVKRLSPEITKKYTEMPWADIAGMRDFVNHQYHNINLYKIWTTINVEIPALKETCTKILKGLML
jgi:uncharacterized protein with HEPN domain